MIAILATQGFDLQAGRAIMGHIYVGSRASWDVIADDAPQYVENIPADS